MKASGSEYDSKAVKTAPAAAVDVLGAAGERRVRESEPPLADPGTSPPPPPLRGDPLLDPGVDDDFWSTKSFQVFLNFDSKFKQSHIVLKFFSTNFFLFLLTNSSRKGNKIVLN